MNPSALEFVPGKKSKGGGSGEQQQQPPAPLQPPTPIASTKLRAAAQPFVPQSKGGTPLHSDPSVTLNESPLSTGASPYTPTDAKLAATFPAAPGADADAEEAQASAAREEAEIPPATACDLSGSKLPSIFNCHNTAATATSSPINFNTAWELYADDHATPDAAPAPHGAPMSFDPVLIASVADLEGFWRLWRYVTPPSSSQVPYTYSWFRKDIKPEWEHPRNKRGGIISIVVFDRDRPGLNDKQVLDDVFFVTLLGCAGESIAECNSTLNGVMLKLRQNKPVTMQLWTAHAEVAKLRLFCNSLRDTLNKVCTSKPIQKLEFFSHHQKQQVSDNSLASRMKPKMKVTPDHVF